MSTILLVEDDAALRDGLTELFTREGYSVTTAANAAEARQNFSVYIDLIILDVTLPDGNGVSLCQDGAIRASQRPSCSSPPRMRSSMWYAVWMQAATTM